MNLDFIAEVWDALYHHIDFNDRSEAADTLINLLIDNDFEADEIKESFRGHKEVLQALKYHVEQNDSTDDDDYDEDLEEEWD